MTSCGAGCVPLADVDRAEQQGLKPAAYHEAKSWLLATPRDELPNAVDELVGDSSLTSAMRDTTLEDREKQGGGDEFAGATPVSAGLVLDLGPPIRPSEAEVDVDKPVAVVVRLVQVDRLDKDGQYVLPLSTSCGPPIVVLAIPSSRSRPKGYIEGLEALRDLVASRAQEGTILLSPGSEEELEAALRQRGAPEGEGVSATNVESATSLSAANLQAAKKLILPIAVALLCSIPSLGEDLEEDEEVDKVVIADSLHKLVALWPDGNPPRAALKRVNEFLMSERRR